MSEGGTSIGLPELPKPPASRGDVAAFTITAGATYLIDSAFHGIGGLPPGTVSLYCGSIAVGLKNAVQIWLERRRTKRNDKTKAEDREKAQTIKFEEMTVKARQLLKAMEEYGYFSTFRVSRRDMDYLLSDIELWKQGILTDVDVEKRYAAALSDFREFFATATK